MGSELTVITQEQDCRLIKNDFMKAVVALKKNKKQVRELLGE